MVTSTLEFVVPGIIALTAMIASFNGGGTRLNVDRFYLRSFDECLIAPIGLLSLVIGKASIGAVRGLFGSFAFIAVAKFLVSRVLYRRAILFRIGANLPGLIFPGGAGRSACQVSSGPGGTFSSLILLPMTFLGGTFFSLSRFPVALKLALYALSMNSCQRYACELQCSARQSLGARCWH